jgi:hypothetical protein
MKLPINFDQFKQDPSKAIMFLLLFVVAGLYYRAEKQSKFSTDQCEQRLNKCEKDMKSMSTMLKSQDSLCSSLITEIKIYRELGKI